MSLRELVRRILETLPPASRRRLARVWAVLSVVALVEAGVLASWYPVVLLATDAEAFGRSPWLGAAGTWLGLDARRELLLALVALVAVLVLLVTGLRVGATLYATRFAFDERTGLSVRLLEAYLCQPYQWLLEKNTTELTREVVEVVPRLVETNLISLFRIYSAGFLAATLLLGIVVADPWVAVVSLCVIGAMFAGVFRVVRPRIEAVGEERLELANRVARAVVEALAAVREARLPPWSDGFVRRVGDLQERLAAVSLRSELLSSLPGTATEITARLGILIVLLGLILRGDPGAVALASVFVLALVRIAPEIRTLHTLASELQGTVPMLLRFHRFLASGAGRPPERRARIPLATSLRLQGIRFDYAARPGEVLRGVDLEIPVGTSLALVGASGAGKSTLAAIAAGLLVPTSGEVLVDGVPLGEDRRAAWRDSVGYVPQEVFLIQGTIRQNIALGIPEDEVDEARIKTVGEISGVREFVKDLQWEYGHWLQERGASLSGGQRQRIALARALYDAPEFLVMDEPTSSLDPLTEKAVLEALGRLRTRVTVLVIAHRLSTVRGCDRICVLEEGRVLASGTYAELLRTCPRFRAMVTAGMVEGTGAGDGSGSTGEAAIGPGS